MDRNVNFRSLVPESVTVACGIELNYVRAGHGTHLIFIHGAMGDWRSWEPQWQVFTQQFDCISYSGRYSSPSPKQMTVRNHNALVDAEDLEHLMDALKIERAILVGSSYGGFTALAMAVRAQHRVCALVAVEPPMLRYAEMSESGAKTVHKFFEASALPARAAFERGDDVEGMKILTAGIIGCKPMDISAEEIARRMVNLQAARSLALSDDEFPFLDPSSVGELEMPVILISGAQTAPLHAATFQEIVKVMPRAHTRIVEGSGHSVSHQKPDVFNAEVLDFLSKTLPKFIVE